MSNKLCKRVISGNRQQEIIMKEVLGGLEEIATLLSYDPWPGDFEIIAIYPPDEEESQPCQEEIVLQSKQRPKAEVICYQEKKEQILKSA